ncbi:MAG: Type II secretory pathway component PulD, partial [Betaproteobacteria bacterium]|nr:Type II secretory pathway component PulD [Betaproteobacteria bacterium]
VSLIAMAGCSHPAPRLPVSSAHLHENAQAAGLAEGIPAPVSAPVVPMPTAQPRLPTYSVVVNEVPVKELLFALARDTKQNIDIHPALTGLVSLNAIDETLPAILDRITRQVNVRWKQEGHTIFVVPDTPYARTYRVDYVNVTRETDSTVAVSGQIGTVTTGTGGTGSQGGAAASNNSSSATVTTKSRNDFWETMEKNIRGILAGTRAQAMSADERAARAEAEKARREERIAQAEAVARAGQNAKDLFASAFEHQESTPLPGDITNDVIVNSVAGTVTVLATERQHRLVQEYLENVTAASQRQVLIEATIVEVQLSHDYQAGVDWGRIASTPGSGIEYNQQLLGTTRLNDTPFTALTFGARASAGIFGAIRLLEQFGTTRVLSSPKVMAINNQTALLKVVRNEVYFQVQQQTSQAANTGTLQSTTTIARTVPIGLVMALTPQINESGVVTLTVRPTVTSEVGRAIDPNPALQIENSVPIVEIREIESVLQLASGQTAILGGLIKDQIQRNRDQVPGVGNTRAGDLFAYRNDQSSKTELVIFLRPTVVKNPSIDFGDLRFLRTQLPRAEEFGSSDTSTSR